MQGDARTTGVSRLHLLGLVIAAAGLALAVLQSAGRLGQRDPLPWGALLVPPGLATVLLGAAGDGAPPFRVRAAWSVVVATLVALHLRPTILPIHWGIDTWPRLSRGWQLAILAGLGVLALLASRWGSVLSRGLRGRRPEASGRRGLAPRVALAAATALLTVGIAWTLRSNVDLGDSWYVLEVAADGRERLVLFPRWPLTSAALGAAYRLLHPMLSARDTVALASCLTGGLSAVIALALVRRLHPSRGRWLAAAFLFSAYGVARPFLGYIEVYPFALLALMAFLWAVITVLQDDAPFWWAALAGGLAVVMYIPLVIPVGAALLGLGVRRLRAGALSARVVVQSASAAVLAPGLVYGWLWLRDIRGRTVGLLPTLVDSLNLGWGNSWLIFVPPRELLARVHLLHVLNQWLLMDAVGLVLVGWGLARGLRRTQPIEGILLLMLLPTLVYTIVMNPLRPPDEDWDLFAHASVLTALLGPLLLIDRVRRTGQWYGVLAVALLGLSLAFTVPGVLAAHFAPSPEIQYPDVFAFEAFFRREGLRYAITDRSTHVYLRTLLRDGDVRSVQFADGTLGAQGPALDITATGAFVLVPESEAALLPNLLALGASYRVASLGGYRVYHGFTPPSGAVTPIASARWRVRASENPAAAARMVDGDPSTRWSSVVPQRDGIEIEIDLGEVVPLAGIEIAHGRCCPWDHPRGLRVAVTAAPVSWREVLVVREVTPRVLGRLRVENGRYRFTPEARPDAITLRFPAAPTRWVRLTALRPDSRPWSVSELRLLRLER